MLRCVPNGCAGSAPGQIGGDDLGSVWAVIQEPEVQAADSGDRLADTAAPGREHQQHERRRALSSGHHTSPWQYRHAAWVLSPFSMLRTMSSSMGVKTQRGVRLLHVMSRPSGPRTVFFHVGVRRVSFVRPAAHGYGMTATPARTVGMLGGLPCGRAITVAGGREAWGAVAPAAARGRSVTLQGGGAAGCRRRRTVEYKTIASLPAVGQGTDPGVSLTDIHRR